MSVLNFIFTVSELKPSYAEEESHEIGKLPIFWASPLKSVPNGVNIALQRGN